MIDKVIKGKLRSTTGVFFGSGQSNEYKDSIFFRDSQNNIIIPGSSIAGVLRAYIARISPYITEDSCVQLVEGQKDEFCNCKVCQMFGSINTRPDQESMPSKVWVYHATPITRCKAFLRDGITIDRESESSFRESKAKFNFEVIPKNTIFDLHIELEKGLNKEQEILLCSALSEWEKGRCFLGGLHSRGLGNFVLEDLNIYELDISDSNKLLKVLNRNSVLIRKNEFLQEKLKEGLKIINEKHQIIQKGTYHSFFQFDFNINFDSGVIVNNFKNNVRYSYDFFPITENGEFIIPGSSLRGVLRSHAEKIAKTIVNENCENLEDFLRICPACNPGGVSEKIPLT
ncbi:MAG: hypothetical protein GF311_10530, partial [Candidatus Lokiarchaeota archaeon]|nr:hypothetical protein [Candidatus Lokiarchaeota archaeon]